MEHDIENIPSIEGPVTLVGDIHGVYSRDAADALENIADKLGFRGNVVLLGDVGLGFPNDPDGSRSVRMLGDVAGNFGLHFWLVRGNHDNPAVWRAAADGTLAVPEGVSFLQQGYCRVNGRLAYVLPGGLSIDLAVRSDGLDWWHDEGVTCEGLSGDMPKVDLLLSHVGPKPPALGPMPRWVPSEVADMAEDEQDTLDAAAAMLQPKEWFYAHYHLKCPMFLFAPESCLDLAIKCRALGIAEVIGYNPQPSTTEENGQ